MRRDGTGKCPVKWYIDELGKRDGCALLTSSITDTKSDQNSVGTQGVLVEVWLDTL